MKKVAAKFSRYSEREWDAIEAAVPPTVCLVGRVLRDRLEQLGRNYASLSMDPDLLKSFVAEEKWIAKFRAEEDRLPPEWRMPPALRQYVVEIERFCQQRNFQLSRAYTLRILGVKEVGPIYPRARSASSKMPKLTISPTAPNPSQHTSEVKPPRNQNARLAHVDSYCVVLLCEWLSIGGDWHSKGGKKAAGAFIAACAGPVEGSESTSDAAIRKRLDRLVRSGAIEDRSAGHGQTKPD